MIPKVIHYCWFGKKPIPENGKKCIDSWKQHCPDYEINLWTEDNFQVSRYPYMKEAYDAQKWAFVSDMARLIIVYDNGGVYLDTDVELIKSLDEILENSFFFAIEKNRNTITDEDSIHVATGLGFGAEKGNQVLKSLIEEYDHNHFRLNNGKFDLTPCPHRNTRALEKYGYDGRDDKFEFNGGTIYPSDYFCPIEFSTKRVNITNNTISIHHYDASWKSEKDKFVGKSKDKAKKILYRLGLYRL